MKVLIQSLNQLNQLQPLIDQQLELAIDFEFYHRSSYRPTLCLILLANDSGSFVIDPLAIGIQKSQTLLKRFNHQQQLIFYASRQDLGIFDDLIGQLPTEFIDLQFAGIFLSDHPKPAQSKIAEILFGTSKCSKTQISDWRQRPLSPHQIDYAFEDISTIWKIYKNLKQRLNQHQWQAITEDSHSLFSSYRQDTDLHQKMHQVASRYQLCEAQQMLWLAVSQWLESNAKKLDVPQSWLLDSQQLLQLCLRPHELSKIELGYNKRNHYYHRKISHTQRQRLRKQLQQLVNPLASSSAPDWRKKLKPFNPKKQLTAEQLVHFEQLHTIIQEVAEEHQICPQLIAGKESITRLVKNPKQEHPLKFGWRRYLLKQRLDFLQV